MSDEIVERALRSDAKLVVIEAPAGCGKTYQGALYANEMAQQIEKGKVLVLTHTHAARSVFAKNTKNHKNKIEIRTIDSLIFEIASVYHRALDLPKDVANWAIHNKGGHDKLVAKVSHFIENSPQLTKIISIRYPFIICDEHQDSNPERKSFIMAIRVNYC